MSCDMICLVCHRLVFHVMSCDMICLVCHVLCDVMCELSYIRDDSDSRHSDSITYTMYILKNSL